jgi:Secretion system C-terminal sorting domain
MPLFNIKLLNIFHLTKKFNMKKFNFLAIVLAIFTQFSLNAQSIDLQKMVEKYQKTGIWEKPTIFGSPLGGVTKDSSKTYNFTTVKDSVYFSKTNTVATSPVNYVKIVKYIADGAIQKDSVYGKNPDYINNFVSSSYDPITKKWTVNTEGKYYYTNGTRLDSLLFSDSYNQNKKLQPAFKVFFNYDSKNVVTYDIFYSADFQTGLLKPSTKTEYTYNSKGEYLTQTSNSWNSFNSTFEKSSVTSYTYPDALTVETSTKGAFSGTEIGKSTRKYKDTAKKLELSYIVYNTDFNTGKLVVSDEYNHKYNADNQETEYAHKSQYNDYIDNFAYKNKVLSLQIHKELNKTTNVYDLKWKEYFYKPAISSVKEDELAAKVSIFPNPTNGNINIQAPENTRVNVLGLDGKYFLKDVNAAESVNIQNFPAGIYLIQLTSNGISTTKKIVKE